MEIKNDKIIEYLDGEVKKQFDEKHNTLTLTQTLEFIKKLKEKHKKEELVIMGSVLDGGIEQGKLFAPTQTLYNCLFTSLVGMFIALFTFCAGYAMNTTLAVAWNSDVDKILGLGSMFERVLEVAGFILFLLMSLLIFAGYSFYRHRVNFDKSHFYKQIIDQCVDGE